MEFRKAAAETRALWAAGNEYLQTAAPWTALKTCDGCVRSPEPRPYRN
jgi:methionyl-tRNA synthetase